MATRFTFANRLTHPRAYPQNNAMDAPNGGLIISGAVDIYARPVDETITDERAFSKLNIPGQAGFWTDRFNESATISGAITFVVWSNVAGTVTVPFRIRARLYRIQAGGGDVETLIGTADAAANVTSGTYQSFTFSFTPSAGLPVYPNERLIARFSLFNPGGGDPGTNTVTLRYGTTTSTGYSYVELADTIATKPNGLVMYPRRTSTIGIGSFMDMLPTKGALAETTAVVNTQTGASPLEIQWTKTAGGAVAEWISLRFKDAWIAFQNSFAVRLRVHESATAANAAPRAKVFLRKPDGTETLLATWTSNTEMGTTSTPYADDLGHTNWTLNNSVTINEDDRLVLRVYIHPGTQTMASGRTCTLTYDQLNTDTNHVYLQVRDSADLKLESDPARSEIVSGGQSTLGVSNGQ